MAETTAVVLAGGASRRMGTDKRALRLLPTSRTFLERTVAIGQVVADRVAVIGGGPHVTNTSGEVAVIADLWPSEGPLGGLLTAFDAFPDDLLIVLAIDYPMLQVGMVARIAAGLDGHDAAVAADGTLHPLVGIYNARRCAVIGRTLFQGGERSMRALMDRLWMRRVGPENDAESPIHRLMLSNVNSPDDLETLRKACVDLDLRGY